MPCGSMADAGGVEIEARRYSAGARPRPEDECLRSFPRLRFAPCAMIDLDARQHAAHLRDLDPGAQLDAFAGERVEHDGRAFGIFAGERRRRLEHGDVGAEAAKRLRQFEADRPAPMTMRWRGQSARSNTVSWSDTACRQARDRRQCRRRAGGDDEAARLDGRRHRPRPCAGSVNRAAPSMTRTPSPAKRSRESCGATASTTSRTCALTAAKSTPKRAALDAEARADRAASWRLGRREQRLGRHRAAVEALAAHAAFFDQHHRHAQGGGRRRGRKPARAARRSRRYPV